jgi:hypothetical protein
MRDELPHIVEIDDIVSQPMVVYEAVQETHVAAVFCPRIEN